MWWGFVVIFVVKQKTAYEMRISDWSSDVCSSDLEKTEVVLQRLREGRLDAGVLALPVPDEHLHVEPLFEEDFLLAVPCDHRLATTTGLVDPKVLADEQVLLLEEGHCLRDQALAVCQMAGASERSRSEEPRLNSSH